MSLHKQKSIQNLHYQVPSLSSELIGEVDNDLVSFRGIPYATVTKRWTHSQVLNTLESPFDATVFGPRCPQIETPSVAAGGNLHSSLYDHEFDCLNLNITVPTKTLEIPSSNLFPLLPVMVWIHGGAFSHGSNSRPRDDPNRLSGLALSNGTPMILISINYRVSALGFASSLDLSTESARNQHPSHLPSSGNYGLIDQRNAFLWIQAHIQAFGGDPNNVTAFGISAGSASIHYHILNGDPLFDRAIMMSGSAPVLGPLHIEIFDKAWEEMCVSLDVSTLSLSSKLEKLRSLDPMTILRSYTRAPMGPMADGIYLPLKWDVFVKQEEGRCKSIILGDTKHDGTIVDYISAHILQPVFLSEISKIFTSAADTTTFLQHFSIRTEEMSVDSYQEALRYFFSVLIFQYPNLCISRSFNGKTFLYHFDEPSVMEGMVKGLSYHGQCATYMFQNQNEKLPDEHVKIAVEMGKIWTAFASGKSKPWEEFGVRERFKRFGGRSGNEESVVTDVKGDGERDYGCLEWLDSHREETRKLFVFAMEMVECKLLKQGDLEISTAELAKM